MDILLVEDDGFFAYTLKKGLENLDHKITLVDNGEKAWEYLKVNGPMLVITDWVMPKIDGLELCKLIRSNSETLYSYVILLTAKQNYQDKLDGLIAGADEFLTKPVEMAELVARLDVAKRILVLQDELRFRTAQLLKQNMKLEQHAKELKSANARLFELASQDGLTGVKNQRCFHEICENAFNQIEADTNPLSVIMLDVDHFKSYNDAFGHQEGDKALRELGSILNKLAPKESMVFRCGGEEFALILPSYSVEDAAVFAERIRSTIENHSWHSRIITASFGIACDTGMLVDIEKLSKNADTALYQSKKNGRNCVNIYTSESNDNVEYLPLKAA